MIETVPFIPGLNLSQFLYEEYVGPILAKHYPGLAYSAALLGPGSEVLGFDTAQSTDHDWGPRLQVFLAESDFEQFSQPIHRLLCQELPTSIHGYPIDLAWGQKSGVEGRTVSGDPAHHGVTIHTLRGFVRAIIAVEFDQPWSASDWLTFTDQHLLSLTRGGIFHDGLGQLEPFREKLRYYPQEIWFYVLAAQWQRISQEEPFMGRCGQTGDELGSRLVASRLVRDIMRLCYLIERQYAPYIKWYGTAFSQLACAPYLTPLLIAAMDAHTWQEREESLSAAYEYVAEMHNGLGITSWIDPKVGPFFDRPFQIIHADRFAEAIKVKITDDAIKALPEYLGSIDQFCDSTDALNQRFRFQAVFK